MRRLAIMTLAILIAGFPPAARAADPFEINVIIALTGGGAFLAKDQQQVFTAIEDQVNKAGGIRGRPIKFVIADDQSSPQVGVQLMNQAIAKKSASRLRVDAGGHLQCHGPAREGRTGAVLSVAGTASGSRELCLFRANPRRPTRSSGPRFTSPRRGWHKVALITSSDATSQDAAKGIDDAFKAQGGMQIVDRETFNNSDVTVDAQMAKIQGLEAADAVIAWTTGPPIGTVLRSVSNLGVTLPIVAGNGNMTFSQMKAYADFLPKELLFPGFAALVPDQLPNERAQAEGR